MQDRLKFILFVKGEETGEPNLFKIDTISHKNSQFSSKSVLTLLNIEQKYELWEETEANHCTEENVNPNVRPIKIVN